MQPTPAVDILRWMEQPSLQQAFAEWDSPILQMALQRPDTGTPADDAPNTWAEEEPPDPLHTVAGEGLSADTALMVMHMPVAHTCYGVQASFKQHSCG